MNYEDSELKTRMRRPKPKFSGGVMECIKKQRNAVTRGEPGSHWNGRLIKRPSH